jgi:hypothetical protein
VSGIDPVVHDTPADEPRYLLISIQPVKQQSITIVRAVVNSKLRKFHGPSPVASVAVRTVSDSLDYAHSMPINRLMMIAVDIRTLLFNVRVASDHYRRAGLSRT